MGGARCGENGGFWREGPRKARRGVWTQDAELQSHQRLAPRVQDEVHQNNNLIKQSATEILKSKLNKEREQHFIQLLTPMTY